jgi:hypothetical protein
MFGMAAAATPIGSLGWLPPNGTCAVWIVLAGAPTRPDGGVIAVVERVCCCIPGTFCGIAAS